MSIAVVVAVLAALLLVVSLAEPAAARVRLPASVLLALFGVVLGSVGLVLHAGALGPAGRSLAAAITDLPLNAEAFLFVFLPLLLFQSAMNTDVRHVLEDASPIFILAIVAVVVSTLVIGFALWPFTAAPLVACLLLGAIVATTDPIAVIGIFREAGAPARLVRLVEGESLLNDAAAITLFALFLDLLVTGRPFDPGAAALDAVVLPLGGAVVGFVGGWAASNLVGALRDNALAPTSVSLALPYLVFVVAESLLHVSGVLAVVAAGMTFAAAGPAKAPPDVWRHLRAVWEQIDWWAASLIFVLASILAPRLLADATLRDLLLLVALIVASLIARAAIVFGLMPALARARMAPSISRPFRWVVFWGGLRGATTLVLALAVTENEAIPREVRSFVAVLATGYVLFTLLVQGATLRRLVRATGVDRLSPVDAALRRDVFAAAHARVAVAVAETAATYRIAPPPEIPLASAAPPVVEAPAPVGERVAIALVTLARAERELVMERVRERAVSLGLVNRLLSDVRRLSDRSRAAGPAGYRQAYGVALAFSRSERLAQLLARKLGWRGWLARALADRFELLQLTSMALRRIEGVADETIRPVLGDAAADAVAEVHAERSAAVARQLDALRLQYPDYAQALERRLLRNAALAFEEREYDRMHEEGLISPELHRDLGLDLDHRRRSAEIRPALDLGLDARTLIARLPMLAGLDAAALKRLADRVEPILVHPGERLIRRGDQGDAAYFIASGAVEVMGRSGVVRLGRGDVFGEIALLTDQERTADVDSIAYGSLLRLPRRAFMSFLDDHPELRARIEATAAQRLRANAGGNA
ncbi:cation:proton antiporter [Methylopila turkensis]|uniref:Sodium:proton antiporter n=1 Tax=Methylopila turkensis TaxID=1437816 RepID=A0A9W6N881_9HYPH|nr:cation:proton antiporter [Methylopila turkensis]GLK81283.1 sodium:proton antiporter [Methylopila turkensis]